MVEGRQGEDVGVERAVRGMNLRLDAVIVEMLTGQKGTKGNRGTVRVLGNEGIQESVVEEGQDHFD